ncbi:MAG: DUF3667 domain-containing protein [Bdellovibrionales bacterium]|nr:DUF3667 domain-containing protein [Bdellovibrionales bacterium]NQZ19842.1 DUF3667 domain-containing protein [Bdellovibrionales bacterium]
MEQKSLYDINNKDLVKDLFNAVTDIEKRFVKTIRELFVTPEKVIYGYIGKERSNYTSAFRYMLLMMFLNYLFFELFLQPEVIGGTYYNSLIQGYEGRVKQLNMTFDQKAFDIFYVEFARLMKLLFKLMSTFTIPAIFLTLWLLFKKLKFNFACRLVISVLLTSQAALVGFLSTPFIFGLTENMLFASSIIYIPMALYLSYTFYRLARPHYKRALMRGITAGLLSIFLYGVINMGYGIGVFSYVKSYTPQFIIKEKNIENTPQALESRQESEKS